MKTKIININEIYIAEIQSDKVEINNVQDALDIFGNCVYQGISKIILHEKNIVPELFDLKTGIAGEVFQKCSNYRVQLAIVGDFSKFKSKSLHDFIYESNKHHQINFVSSTDEAIEKLVKY
ncbi:MAG TPA: DUF4180 domain-containing protein [Bacteroidales bacterium]|nr:DUF4180 domain-containing protein [Bacteroidales bacterium]